MTDHKQLHPATATPRQFLTCALKYNWIYNGSPSILKSKNIWKKRINNMGKQHICFLTAWIILGEIFAAFSSELEPNATAFGKTDLTFFIVAEIFKNIYYTAMMLRSSKGMQVKSLILRWSGIAP